MSKLSNWYTVTFDDTYVYRDARSLYIFLNEFLDFLLPVDFLAPQTQQLSELNLLPLFFILIFCNEY